MICGSDHQYIIKTDIMEFGVALFKILHIVSFFTFLRLIF